MNTIGLNAAEIEALGGRIVTGNDIPDEIKAIAAEMGIDPSQMRVIDMTGTILESLPDDARFLGEVVAGEADFAPTPEGLQLTADAKEFGASCGDPRCHACYEPIGGYVDAEPVPEEGMVDVGSFFRQLIERMEARSLNQEDTPVPQQDEAAPETQAEDSFPDKDDMQDGPVPFLMGEDPSFDREIIERLVGGQIALQASVDATFGVLKHLLEPEELEQVDHITGFHLAVEQAAQINRADIIGQAKGFVLGRYGFEWEDVPFAQQRQVLEFFERKNDA